MAEITRQRTGLFLRELFRILINKPEGMPAKEVLAEITQGDSTYGVRERVLPVRAEMASYR